jgi:hypothetical protein
MPAAAAAARIGKTPMWWFKKQPDDDAALRAQLLKARAKVEYQLSIMQAGPASHGGSGWRPRFKENAEALAETLREIDESLAALGPEERSKW